MTFIHMEDSKSNLNLEIEKKGMIFKDFLLPGIFEIFKNEPSIRGSS